MLWLFNGGKVNEDAQGTARSCPPGLTALPPTSVHFRNLAAKFGHIDASLSKPRCARSSWTEWPVNCIRVEYKPEDLMKYLLMDYVNESGWPELTRSEKQHWLGAYVAYIHGRDEEGGRPQQ